MTEDQTAFMDNLRSALNRTGEPAPYDPADFTPREPGDLDKLLAATERTREERLALIPVLQKFGEFINLSVHVVETMDQAGDGVADIVLNSDTEWGGDKQVMVHDDPVVEALDLPGKLGDIPVHVARFEDGEDELAGKARLRKEVVDSFVGVTTARWCAADCAALAMPTAPGHGRAVSLVPSIHVAVLPLDRLLADLPEVYAKLESEPFPAGLTFISGPSKTADIEAVMVHGAHGPKEMHLIVVTG